MARIRSIKPNFWKSRSVRRLTDRQKLVWIGLWNLSDDEGRLMDEPTLIAGELWALDTTPKQIDVLLDQLAAQGRLVRYVVAGEGYIEVTNWTEHQKINRPTDSLFPPVPLSDRSVSAHGARTDGSRLEGKGEERKGGEAPPAPHCAKHSGGTDKPCRACGDARRAFEAWQLAEKTKPTPQPGRADPKTCKHRKHKTENYCVLCDEVFT